MAKKIKKVASTSASSKPKYPYTITMGALRKFLQEVPKRPKPPKVDFALLKAWGIHNNNARTVLSVVKALGLVDGSDTPTNYYIEYMKNDTGATSLADRIKETYTLLFQTSLEPWRETQENLKNFFNINSGGSEDTINYQIQTFKTLCEFADFNSPSPSAQTGSLGNSGNMSSNSTSNSMGASIDINLHIHLPENKSRADYEEIIKDIAKYIYGK